MAKNNKNAKQTPHHKGHRDRLRERFKRAGIKGIQDYELMELVLFLSIPRRDVKPLAKELLAQFNTFAGVMDAPLERLTEIKGISEKTAGNLKLHQATAEKIALSRLDGKQIISSWDELLRYSRIAMAEKDVEQFRVLYLNRKNGLIADELQNTGTVDHTPVYPREIVKRALILSASAIIIMHNHPSGDPTPSKADIKMTNEIDNICKSMGIVLHDHLIVARRDVLSFKSEGLL